MTADTITITFPISCADAAKILDVNPSTTARIAKEKSIGRKVGQVRLLMPPDLDQLRGLVRGVVGNPNFGPDFHREKPQKKPAKRAKRKSKK